MSDPRYEELMNAAAELVGAETALEKVTDELFDECVALSVAQVARLEAAVEELVEMRQCAYDRLAELVGRDEAAS